jgi:hypothetical protein
MTDEQGTMDTDRPTPTGDEFAALEPVMAPDELAEIVRLGTALDLAHLGLDAGVDPHEDPELAALVSTALAIDSTFHAVTETRSFASFHNRSRAAILHSLEAERPVPIWERFRLATAAAAAVAAVTIAVTTFGAPLMDSLRSDEGGSGATVTVANLTHRSSQEQLDRLNQSVQGIHAAAASGQPISSAQLHQFTENTARMAETIFREPDSVSPDAVRTFAETNQQAQAVLNSAATEPGAEDAAVAAQRAAEDGIVVSARYLGGDTGTSSSAATPEPTATATPTATPTTTPTATATPTTTPTSTPAGTPVDPNVDGTGTDGQ